MAEENQIRLIVGLGNPGKAYELTRHNAGFRVVQTFAEKKGLPFRQAAIVSGEIAQGRVNDHKVILLLPMTYMNSSGQAVKLCVDYFKIALENILVVSDDVNLPFGKLRIRANGSAGGHNGLKSVEEHLGTQEYPRLRIGIGEPHPVELAEYVLTKFTAEETSALTEVVDQTISMIEQWITVGIKAASQQKLEPPQGELNKEKKQE
ncbi:MAG TPA: aminoacyl-tRNA hydrolase [Rhabdochlamydiaceae bacterium]|nr:aminoacyl-tRNA hydrolase [Rhabdochlamydiaceae bacterium]